MFRKALAVAAMMLSLTVGTAAAQLAPGAEAPDFNLFGVDYRYHRLSEYLEREDVRAVVVVFTCNHCPESVRYEDPLIKLGNTYQPRGFPFILVNPNPADMVARDGFPQMIERAAEKEFPFPYVYDETQETARAYGATRTPEIFVVDRAGRVVYTGSVDTRRFQAPHFLADALEALEAGREIERPQSRPFGCTIKFRPTE